MPLPRKPPPDPQLLPTLPSKAEGSVTQCGRTRILIFESLVFYWKVKPHSQPVKSAFPPSPHPFTVPLSIKCYHWTAGHAGKWLLP